MCLWFIERGKADCHTRWLLLIASALTYRIPWTLFIVKAERTLELLKHCYCRTGLETRNFLRGQLLHVIACMSPARGPNVHPAFCSSSYVLAHWTLQVCFPYCLCNLFLCFTYLLSSIRNALNSPFSSFLFQEHFHLTQQASELKKSEIWCQGNTSLKSLFVPVTPGAKYPNF